MRLIGKKMNPWTLRVPDREKQTVHQRLRNAQAFHRRWWSLLSVALQRTVATNLLDHPGLGCAPGAGPEPPLADILGEAREPVGYSRLPMRQ